MSRLVRCEWSPNLVSGLARHDRQGREYAAYIPDRLAGREFRFDGTVAADISDAERAIAQLNGEAKTLVDTEALARLLLRAESVASSRIEGLEIGGRRLLRAEASLDLNDGSTDVTASEVLANINAMLWAVQTVAEGTQITVDQLLEIQRKLLTGTFIEHHAGKIRAQQNWIGGSSHNPCTAAFVPPPAEYVHDLLDDLTTFASSDDLPPVAQAAIAHAQFETIHPFVDGNGRTGRALIHMILRRRGLAVRVLPPISLVLATRSRDYINGLAATRYNGPPQSEEAHAGINLWVGQFAAACQRAVADATEFEHRADALQNQWRQRVGSVRAGSGTDLLIRALPGAPIVTATSAAAIIGRTYQATNEAIDRLVEAGVLTKVTVGRRNRAFEAAELIDAFTDLEQQLASPDGNTKSSPPSRPTPQKRQRR